MFIGSLTLVFIVCLITTMVLVRAVARISVRRGWTDAPDGKRKIHSAPIPNSGGVGMVGGWLAGICLFAAIQWLFPSLAINPAVLPAPVILVGAVLIAGVGFLDDLYDLHFRYKLLAQLGVTAFVLAGGVRIGILDDVMGGGTPAMIASFAMTALWMVGTMNAVNFLDGMDGLASGVVGIILVGLAGVYLIGDRVIDLVLCVALVGTLLGFLRYNFYPARIFMGDSGSLFLGYLLAVYALHGKGHDLPVLALVIPVVAMGLPILDTGTSMARRLIKRESMFSADRDHIHHRLALKFSHRNTVLFLYVVALFFAIGAMLMAAVRPRTAVSIFVGGTVIVGVFLYWLGYIGRAKPPDSFSSPSLAGAASSGNGVGPSVSPRRELTQRAPGRSRANGRLATKDFDELAPMAAPER